MTHFSSRSSCLKMVVFLTESLQYLLKDMEASNVDLYVISFHKFCKTSRKWHFFTYFFGIFALTLTPNLVQILSFPHENTHICLKGFSTLILTQNFTQIFLKWDWFAWTLSILSRICGRTYSFNVFFIFLKKMLYLPEELFCAFCGSFKPQNTPIVLFSLKLSKIA